MKISRTLANVNNSQSELVSNSNFVMKQLKLDFKRYYGIYQSEVCLFPLIYISCNLTA